MTRIGILGVMLACGVLQMGAQGQATQFEVASVKPAAPGARGSSCTGGPGTTDPGMLSCNNYSLSLLVMMAYNLRPFQLQSLDWMDSTRYDIVAKVPANTSVMQFQVMLQDLLVTRFALRTLRANQEATLFELTVDKDGPKLKESTEPAATPELRWRPPAYGPPVATMVRVTRKGDSMEDFAKFLADSLGVAVKDATGLRGRYDYALQFLMEPGGRAAGLDVDSRGAQPGASDPAATLPEVVHRQLGLNLKKTKGPVERLVVDSARKEPLGN